MQTVLRQLVQAVWSFLWRWMFAPSPARLRAAILAAAYRQTQGKLNQLIDLQPIVIELRLESLQQARLLAGQMVGKRWFETQNNVPDGQPMLTAAGVEEAESLEKNAMARFSTDHPTLYALLILLVGGALNHYFQAAPVINNNMAPPVNNIAPAAPPVNNVTVVPSPANGGGMAKSYPVDAQPAAPIPSPYVKDGLGD